MKVNQSRCTSTPDGSTQFQANLFSLHPTLSPVLITIR